jgi:glycosyltransferase involved in cell wall biosynthesis
MHTALYSSSPDRGLDLILSLWPRVREQLPDAELLYCYSSVYDSVAEKNPKIKQFRDRVRELAEQPGVTNLGSLTQPQLAKVMQQTAVWLAPSYNTVHDQKFYETYCIGAVEAAAAGCCVVVSDWGALPERVEVAVNSVVIPAPEEGNGIDEDAWVSGIVNAMTQVIYEPSDAAKDCTWSVVADDFDRVVRNGVALVDG